jgi:transposase
VVAKKLVYGAPVGLNYPAMFYFLVARITERIPTIKDLIKRLKNDYIFRLDYGFLLSDMVPSEASYSRMLTKISQMNVLEQVQEILLLQAISEGFIDDKTIAIDATHIEARDQAPAKKGKPTQKPKKRGHKSKAEREQWLKKKLIKRRIFPYMQNRLNHN